LTVDLTVDSIFHGITFCTIFLFVGFIHPEMKLKRIDEMVKIA